MKKTLVNLMGKAAPALVALCVATAFLAVARPAVALEIGTVDVDLCVDAHPAMAKFESKLEATKKERNDAFQIEIKAQFGLADLSDAELAKLTEDERRAIQQKYMMENERLNNDMMNEQKAVLQTIEKDILETIKKVAAEKKLELVFNKQVLLVGGSDITENVVAEIKKLSADAPK